MKQEYFNDKIVVPKIKYSSQLDSLRAVAVIITLLGHWITDIWGVRIEVFDYGVDIFFAISGFLITSILIKEKKEIAKERTYVKHLGNFYIRRFLRLMPIYFMYLLGLLLLAKLFEFELWSEGSGFYFFTYLPNILIYFDGPQSKLVNHFWSLGVEEQFYLIWPFIIYFLSQKYLRGVLILVIIIGVGVHFAFDSNVRYLPFGNFHTLGFGALMAYFNEYEREKNETLYKYKSLILFFSLVLLFITLSGKAPLLKCIHQIALMLLSGILTLSSYYQWNGLVAIFFDFSIMQRIGKISYGIYVMHKPVHYLIGPWLMKISFLNNGYLLMLIYALITFIIATLSYKYFETFFLRLKTKYS